MATNDRCVTIAPYFRVANGKIDNFKQFCEQLVKKAETEAKCQYYGFSFDGNRAFCREAYDDAEGLLIHLQNVETVLAKALEISNLERVEIHGPATELEKLRPQLAHLNPHYFTLEYGFGINR